jgi:glutamate-ammonia-ligase adenylyltransferase
VLGAAHRYPELITFSDNIRQLEALAKFGVIDAATAQWLMDAYRGYRAVLHHLSLESVNERVVDAAPYAEKRARVREIWDTTFKEPREEHGQGAAGGGTGGADVKGDIGGGDT